MVRLDDLHPEEAEGMRRAVQRFRFPDLDSTPWLTPPPLAESTIALVTSAGLHRRGDQPFRFGDGGYRLIPDDVDFAKLVQTQVSVNFDRTHYQQDVNVVLPRDRLRELAAAGEVGGVSPWHYSVLGSSPDPLNLAAAADDMARRMRDAGVHSAVLSPV